ncbi:MULTISPECIES: sensor histidine kinase [unclassified Streptomyces]|uniref:sensor histidine kinase n=1 Tax=unclassified Streptomyces TaxID=2593676 RepID=UPI002E78D5D9|nr:MULTISPECIES: histidine kinase [unclassified Streptomyces]MEE1764737.1 histidine kinase [Streptomyces sp. SP18BB07]MEE1837603.1 histidine kinase [Streptomyces sp. SP17KL33]
MGVLRNWLLPALLAVAQLSLWPGLALSRGQTVETTALVVGLAVTVVACVVLGVRRRHPVVVALVIDTLLTAGFVVPDRALPAAAVAGVVALYSVAVRRPARTAVLVASVLVASGVVRALLLYDSAVDVGGEALASLAVYAGTVGAGRSRRRWLAGRRAAEQELARAEEARVTAATTERHRLARELHDVSAHHLTSVVVTANAARHVGDRNPRLTADALRLAAEAGRETVVALQRLVAVMWTSAADEESPLAERVAELAAGCVRLGQRVDVDIAPGAAGLTGPVAEAAFGIAREALTNTLRYAPGATVRVVIRDSDGALDVAVEDDATPPPATASTTAGAPSTSTAVAAPATADTTRATQGLGGGRGTAGMRDRARGVGGTLVSGARRDAPGWSVRARLPRPSSNAGVNSAPPRWSWTDAATVLALTALPVVAVLIERPGATAAACPPAVLHALALVWRRRAPWTVLLVVLATAWIPALCLAFGVLPSDVAWALTMAGAGADCVALYAVAAFAGPADRTWPAIGLVAAGLASTTVALGLLDGADAARAEGIGPWFHVFLAVLLTLPLALVTAGVWGVGVFVRRRREYVTRREDSHLTAVVWSAVVEARAERQRIAAELRQAVLHHAHEVVAHAERDDLDGAADQARAGLAAMRELLAVLKGPTEPLNATTGP